MAVASKYQAHAMDEHAFVHYPTAEHRVWQQLITCQNKLIEGRACREYIVGLQTLNLPDERIPQLYEVNQILLESTGWQTQAVPALISFDKFFSLLARKYFPVATFIRSPAEIKYLQEPDVFHEIYGHCPLLTNPAFAHFTQKYGALGEKASKEDRVFLARLYWFTVEFGLIETKIGRRIYGGGVLSSPGETPYSLEDQGVDRRAFDIIDVLRTPYRIDIMQPIYYVIDGIEQLFEIANMDVMAAIAKAKSLGLFKPSYPEKSKT